MIRELADHDLSRIPAVLQYPIRDALIAFAERMKIEAVEWHRHYETLFVMGGLTEQPELPTILRPRR